jgi:hypothetical protein
MVSQLQKVIENIMVPMFPEIESVEVEQLGLGGFYRITYFMRGKLKSHQDYIKIMEETTTLYKMLSPEEKGDIIVDFKKVDD